MIERIEGQGLPTPQTATAVPVAAAGELAFAEQLRRQLEDATGMRVSNHMEKRLQSRQIEMTPDDVQRLATAVEKAEDRGSRESVVLMDDLAFVVSLRNKTLVTAVDAASRKENVFTNIDSVVIA